MGEIPIIGGSKKNLKQHEIERGLRNMSKVTKFYKNQNFFFPHTFRYLRELTDN